MEIERKYLVDRLPDGLEAFPCHEIEQGYLCTAPVVRVRREDEDYYLTYKGKGLMVREEYNLPLTKDAYRHLIQKADGTVLEKKRYLVPLSGTAFTAELDLFQGALLGLRLVEVEFRTEEEAADFTAPSWFGRDVTFSGEYQNSRLSGLSPEDIAGIVL